MKAQNRKETYKQNKSIDKGSIDEKKYVYTF